MAPVKATRKRKSNQSSSDEDQMIPTMKGTPQRSPIKKRRLGLSLAQKQALIDNLQLEITERARRLRAQYNIQAQQLRSRVEMRVNRIPTALRKAKLGDLLAKSLQPQPPRPKSTYPVRPPPVPAKDGTSLKPISRKPVPTNNAPAAGRKRMSTEISGADKENQDAVENPKKRVRGAPAAADSAPIQPGQILSPTSSNTRIAPRERPASPMKSMISRPASPIKPPPKASSNMLSSMVERAKGTRPAVGTRKATASSTASSNTGPTTTRTRQAAALSRPPTAASTRGRRKVSATSEASEASTATVVKKTTGTRPAASRAASRAAKPAAPPPAKRTVMSTLKSATTKKPPASKAAAPATTGTGRTLRKRA
ncbi:Borealin N terminal-domain-containing protein [Hypoxylon cercidicola]|nr:Borealin N terminal-domain-containing protein [Hypoxylon cercidicola]